MTQSTHHIKDLIPDSKNARKHNPRNIGMIERSLQEVGAARSIVIDEDNHILAGNGTIEAAAQAGIERVRIIEADGNEIIAVKRRGLTPTQKQRLALYDNRTAETAEWDNLILADLLNEQSDILDGMFDDAEIDALIESLNSAAEIGGGGDEFDTTPQDGPTRVQRGDLWQLGRHRLLCGDSTNAEDVQRLMQGERADMVFTDPPYGVEYVGKTKDALTIQNDALGDEGTYKLVKDAINAWPLREGGAFYVCSPPGNTETAFRLAIRDAGYQLRQCLVWCKNHFVMGRQDYHWRHESILYGWRDGAGHYFIDDRTQDTVWEIDRPAANPDHPTMKPVELIEKALNNSSLKHDCVFDGFGGSGSTLVACERTNRDCRTIELDPRYCDVILRRWEAETGQQAVKVDTLGT